LSGELIHDEHDLSPDAQLDALGRAAAVGLEEGVAPELVLDRVDRQRRGLARHDVVGGLEHVRRALASPRGIEHNYHAGLGARKPHYLCNGVGDLPAGR